MQKYSKKVFKTSPQFITKESGEKTGVVLDVETFQRIVEILEDYEDNLLMDEVEDEPGTAWEDVKKELSENGRL